MEQGSSEQRAFMCRLESTTLKNAQLPRMRAIECQMRRKSQYHFVLYALHTRSTIDSTRTIYVSNYTPNLRTFRRTLHAHKNAGIPPGHNPGNDLVNLPTPVETFPRTFWNVSESNPENAPSSLALFLEHAYFEWKFGSSPPDFG